MWTSIPWSDMRLQKHLVLLQVFFHFLTITTWMSLLTLSSIVLAIFRWAEHRIATRVLKGPWTDCFSKLWSCIEHVGIWKFWQIIRGKSLWSQILAPIDCLGWICNEKPFFLFAVLFHSRPTCSLRMLKDHNHSSIIYQRRNTNFFFKAECLLSHQGKGSHKV